MIRQAAFVLYSAIAVGQIQPEDPFDGANQAYWQARQKGQYDVATAQRERMNQLLQTEPADQPQFAGRAQSLAQAYDGDGMSATGLAVLEGALARADAAKAPGQARASLLLTLASFWERDRNLLKSLASLERAAAVLEQTPVAEDPPQQGAVGKGWFIAGNSRADVAVRPGVISRVGSATGLSPYGAAPTAIRMSAYTQLADLYQRLGRRDQAAAVLAKMKALPAQSNNWNLAQYYQQHGDLEQAAAIYRKQMEESQADPQQMLFPAQSLAGIYEEMKRPADAEVVLREAITATDASGKQELAMQSSGLRQRLAMLLYQSGHAEAADQAFPPPADNGPMAMWLTVNYANYLGATKRAGQGETLLADYLAAHPSLNAQEQASVLMPLANLARMAGYTIRADEYQVESSQKLLRKDPPADVVLIGPTLQKAQTEANTGNAAEAIALATQAIAQSGNASDREALVHMVPSVANAISIKAPVQADELYRNVTAVTQSWSADTMLPWLTMLGGYPRFLLSLQRSGEGPPAIERYRSALKTSRGGDTGWMEEPLRLTIELERGRNSPQAAILAAQNLLGLEETLDGPTSEPLYRAAETLADLYRFNGDPARALPLFQQMIAIADAVFRADDPRRGQSRTNAAAVLIAERRPDEAEPLVLEAIQLRTVNPAGSRDGLTQMLEQIQAMKKAR
jgi:Tetratricopeptide repeat